MSEIKLLDHGYVKLIPEGCWGSDELIIESARMSTAKGFNGWGDQTTCITCSGTGRMWDNGNKIDCDAIGCVKGLVGTAGDEKLLAYLWNNRHTTPFEMGGLTVEVQAPIMVYREWHRHRTQSYSEMSGRYIKLPELFYIPSLERLMNGKQSSTNKQASQAGFSEQEASTIQETLLIASHHARERYEKLIEQGLAKELARLVLPVNQYSRMRASANLWNWLHFLRLRLAEGAQWEIRQYAQAVGTLVQERFPRTHGLFVQSL